MLIIWKEYCCYIYSVLTINKHYVCHRYHACAHYRNVYADTHNDRCEKSVSESVKNAG